MRAGNDFDDRIGQSVSSRDTRGTSHRTRTRGARSEAVPDGSSRVPVERLRCSFQHTSPRPTQVLHLRALQGPRMRREPASFGPPGQSSCSSDHGELPRPSRRVAMTRHARVADGLRTRGSGRRELGREIMGCSRSASQHTEQILCRRARLQRLEPATVGTPLRCRFLRFLYRQPARSDEKAFTFPLRDGRRRSRRARGRPA